MQLVRTRGQLLLEETAVVIELDQRQMFELKPNIAPSDTDRDEYVNFWAEIQRKDLETADQGASRQLVIGAPDRCLTSIQLLRDRDENIVVAHFRSSSSKLLPADLGFISRVGLRYSATRAVILIGSLHIELAGVPNHE